MIPVYYIVHLIYFHGYQRICTILISQVDVGFYPCNGDAIEPWDIIQKCTGQSLHIHSGCTMFDMLIIFRSFPSATLCMNQAYLPTIYIYTRNTCIHLKYFLPEHMSINQIILLLLLKFNAVSLLMIMLNLSHVISDYA